MHVVVPAECDAWDGPWLLGLHHAATRFEANERTGPALLSQDGRIPTLWPDLAWDMAPVAHSLREGLRMPLSMFYHTL